MVSRFSIVSLSLACLLPLAAHAQATPPAAPAAAAPAIQVAPVAPPAAAADTRPVTRGELPALVREALMSNPEMIKDAVEKLREKQAAEAKTKADAAMVKYKDALFNDPDAPTVGAKDADVVIVEFFDYHCGYCRRMVPAVTQLLKEDKKVRFIFKEFPILSEDSVNASRAALAVNRIAKDKYFDYHQALMKIEGKYDEKALLDAGKKLGISSDKLKAEMAKPEVTAILDKDREMGAELGVTGTPAIIVGNTLIPGAIPYEEMKKVVENVRAGKKPIEDTPPAAPTAN
jgi:protein-disulfide isomerase